MKSCIINKIVSSYFSFSFLGILSSVFPLPYSPAQPDSEKSANRLQFIIHFKEPKRWFVEWAVEVLFAGRTIA
ncbi:hypothetical protein Pfo_002231 [Paulownia fortunei]|nr:hypothetical protein Pfo_002231 [Paulownia fortunei]